jgi:predicted ester cyclase
MHATFGELNTISESIVAEGDTVAARMVWRGVHKGPWYGVAPTGKRFEFRGMTFWRIRDGKIAERWAEIDFASPEKQLKG